MSKKITLIYLDGENLSVEEALDKAQKLQRLLTSYTDIPGPGEPGYAELKAKCEAIGAIVMEADDREHADRIASALNDHSPTPPANRLN